MDLSVCRGTLNNDIIISSPIESPFGNNKEGDNMTLIGMIILSSSIISFKDADKIKSWDAWDDHKARSVSTNILQKEKISVTWEKLNKMTVPGVKEIGRLQTRTSPEIKSSKWSVGCETMDRDYAEWDSFKDLLPMLGVKPL